MPTVSRPPMVITLAVAKEISLPPIAALLALQMAQEPQTPVHLHEIRLSDLYSGLSGGRYNVAIALQTGVMTACASESLWSDELGVAVPVGSPLLAHSEITADMLDRYNVLLWPPCARPSLHGQIAALTEAAGCGSSASSFELMATLVAAGYGVGIAPRARIMQARGWGIVLRPLAGGPHRVSTELLRAPQDDLPAVDRFVERVRRMAADYSQGYAVIGDQT